MESHDNQAPVDGAQASQVTGPASMENSSREAVSSPNPEPASGSIPDPASAPADQANQGMASQGSGPEQPSQDPAQDTRAQEMGQQAQYQPNILMDPATGQLYYAPGFQGQPVQMVAPGGQFVYGAQQVPPGQIPAQEAAPQPDFSNIIKSVEDFAEGDASVADVVKTLYSETAQDDQFWKGAIVGAAATVLLTSESVRKGMGNTFGGLFGNKAAQTPTPAPDVDPDKK